MMPTLFTARYLLPITAPPIEDGALLVDGDKILKVGSRKELRTANPDVDIVDFGDAVLLPPLVNAHTHLELSNFPEWATHAGSPEAPQDFVDWILWLVRVRQSVDENQVKASLKKGMDASLVAGTGAVGDIFSTLAAVDAYSESKLYGKVFAEVLGHDLEAVERRLEELSTLVNKSPGTFLEWGLSPHTPFTLSATVMERVLEYAEHQSLQKCVHLGESQEEADFLSKGQGAIAEKLYPAAQWNPAVDPMTGHSPVEALWKKGHMNAGDLVVHGVQVNDGDIKQIKESGCTVVLCPRSNEQLDVGKAPVKKYLQAGVPLALGTDSLASSTSLSVWEELAFAQEWFSGSADATTWLQIASLGGAEALGVSSQVGSLASGKEASFQVVRLPVMPRVNELEATLCVAGNKINVAHLYLGGQDVLH